jgi:hypothetical protein
VPQAQIWQKSTLPWVGGVHALPGSPEQQAFTAPKPAA